MHSDLSGLLEWDLDAQHTDDELICVFGNFHWTFLDLKWVPGEAVCIPNHISK